MNDRKLAEIIRDEIARRGIDIRTISNSELEIWIAYVMDKLYKKLKERQEQEEKERQKDQ